MQHKSGAATTLVRFSELVENPEQEPRQATYVENILEEAPLRSKLHGVKSQRITRGKQTALARLMESIDLALACMKPAW